ncbi:uncharacterized protein K02A2.6-like, partial [Osmia bicornis bicornis]|uniref:uncharacterized protein K02A2.6-like n=1 Tax=Osmia bicornis bicornis TaxID=1437191 RepID=UPI001EAF1491
MESTGTIFKPPKSLSLEGNISENWRKFKQAFEIFINASGKSKTEEEVKVAILLNLIGEEAVELFNTFTLTEQQKKVTQNVIDAFEAYCMPKKNVVYERYLFNNRNQKEGEKFEQFVTDIKIAAQKCEFGALHDQMIRDRIVMGTNDPGIQEKLLRVPDLDMQKAIDYCQAAEISKLQVKTFNEKTVDSLQKKVSGSKTKEEKANPQNESSEFKCRRCLRWHGPRQCPAFGKDCNKCRRKNHFTVACRAKEVSEIQESEDIDLESSNLFVETVCTAKISSINTWMETVIVEDTKICFKLDSGAQVNILPNYFFSKINKQFEVKPTNIILETFGGFKIRPRGTVQLKCRVKNNEIYDEFIIVNKKVTPILGLAACVRLNLISKVDLVRKVSEKDEFIKKNKDIFEGLGRFEEKCNIAIDSSYKPVARPPRRIPLKIKEKLKNKLLELQEKKVISKVDNPKGWVSNLVIIEKPDKSLRLCLDPRDLNKAIKRNSSVLIPTVEEISEKLCNKNIFTVLDLKDGFWHVELDESSSELCTFSTVFGNWKFNRLPFGVNMAPEYFQEINNRNFGDIDGVTVYFDDICISAETNEEHDKILKQVLTRARKLGIKFNQNKIQYKVSEVKYLGHVFSKEGMKIDPERVRAIEAIKNPKSKIEVQRILGMINYVRQYIPNLSKLTAPLRELLQDSVEFHWFEYHLKALQEIKIAMKKAPVLNFNANREIFIQSDASGSGLGCCLLQDEKPVFFASRSLSESEKNYAVIEKELLAIVFATNKFHQFVYGRKVHVLTDHKPLVNLLNEKNIGDIPSPRLQRMKIKLLRYEIVAKHVPGKLMHVADLLSRSYLEEAMDENNWISEVVHSISTNLNISEKQKREIQKATELDPTLNEVIKHSLLGWPKAKSGVRNDVKFYFKYQNELSVQDNMLFFNYRLVIPSSLRQNMLKLLHESHLGIEKTKARARQLIYWPGLMNEIENMILKCATCEKYRSLNSREPLITHDIPDIPFNKIACDICECAGNEYLIIQDYYSKWLEILKLKNKTAGEVILNLKKVFATHGIPKTIICDNQPFSSYELKVFAQQWNFDVVTSSPHYPRSNGQAERAVQVAKKILKKCIEEDKELDVALLEYRNTPITGLTVSPAQVLFSRRTRTKVPIHSDLLKPKVESQAHQQIEKRQKIYKYYHDRNCKPRHSLNVGEDAVIFNKNNKKWESAKILQKHRSPRSYILQNQNGNVIRRNSVHLKKSYNEYKRIQEQDHWDQLQDTDCNRASNDE